MGTTNEPFAHVYHRIAERVSKQYGVNIDSVAVEDVLKDRNRSPMQPEIEADILSEAREYGLEI